jgi:two-component system CheB/CheR fusion protein
MKKNTKTPQELALHYMQALVDVARESFVIIGPDLRVIAANPIFYKTFKVVKLETEKKLLFDLGNGQWDIPELKKLLKEILPKKKVVRNYEVTHRFETIGEKTMQLNARQIDSVQLIILAIEDTSERKVLENKLLEHAKTLERNVAERTAELTARITELEQLNKSMVGRELKMIELKHEIEVLKKRVTAANKKHHQS